MKSSLLVLDFYHLADLFVVALKVTNFPHLSSDNASWFTVIFILGSTIKNVSMAHCNKKKSKYYTILCESVPGRLKSSWTGHCYAEGGCDCYTKL
jgi:hypothetical protein